MGLKPMEVKSLLLKDFNLMLLGHERRLEHDKNMTRHIMAFQQAFGGMGASEWMGPDKIWPLQMDKDLEIRPITTLKQAMQLLKEFK